MKSMLLVCAVLLLSCTIHCQEEAAPTTTTPQPPAASEESAKAPETSPTTEAPTTTAGPESANSTSAKDDDDKPKEKPKESESEEAGPPPAQQPKIIFVQQHVRDPATGIIYTRQVPLIPSNYLRPLPYQPRGQQQPDQQPNEPEQEQPTRYDPLGQFSGAQKKRQFFQDMLVSQLVKFEGQIEPMIEREQNVTEKNDLEEVLGAVGELKRVLEAHQIFNISDKLNNWKQGRLGQEEQGGAESAQGFQGPQGPVPPPQQYRPRGPPQPSPQQVQLRTLILVPQNRVLGPPQMPQQQQQQYAGVQYNPMGRPATIPVIHLHQRRGAYQPTDSNQQQQQQQPQGDGGQFEPEAAPSEEGYSKW